MNRSSLFHTKFKVIISFSLIAIVLIVALYFTFNSLSQLLGAVNTLSKPEQKITRINQLLTNLVESESHIRSYTLSQEAFYLKEYQRSLENIENQLDTLRRLTYTQKKQQKRLDSLSFLLNKKIAGLNSFLQLKRERDKQNYSATAIKRINQRTKDSIKVNSTLKTTATEYQEQIPSLPRVEVEPTEKKGFFNKLFGNKKPSQPSLKESDSMITTIRKEVKVDTIVVAQAVNDSLLGKVKSILANLQQEEASVQTMLTQQELQLLTNDQAIMNHIRQVVADMQKEEIRNNRINAKEATDVASRASIIIFVISIGGLLSSVVFISLLVKDISKSQFYRKKLEKAKSHAEKLSQTKQQFLANMSHEIRTPLNAILGFSEQLTKTSNLPTEAAEQAQAIHNSSEFLLSTVNDILDLSKIEAGQLHFEKADFLLQDVINQTIRLIQRKVDLKGLQLKVDLPKEPTYLKGDPFRLKQILLNLLSNAEKFTEEGFIEITCNAADNGFGRYVVTVLVKDTGIGIKQEQLEKIFENFSQADITITRKYGGTGLGLAITKKLVQLQGGTITVSSEHGKGSEFCITLPLEKGSASDTAIVEAPKLQVNSKSWENKKVLIVEDDDFNIILLRSILKKYNITPSVATHSRQAIEFIQSQDFDIILTDVHLPEMSGLQLMLKIRQMSEEKAKTPIVAVTAHAIQTDLDRYLQLGMDAYLLKPFKEEELVAILLEFLGEEGQEQKKSEKHKVFYKKIEEESSYTIDTFAKFAAGDPDAIELLLTSFLTNHQENMKTLSTLFKEKNLSELSELAHKMYPTYEHINATETASALKKIQYFDQNTQKTSELNAHVAIVKEEAAEIRKFIEKQINFLKNGKEVDSLN